MVNIDPATAALTDILKINKKGETNFMLWNATENNGKISISNDENHRALFKRALNYASESNPEKLIAKFNITNKNEQTEIRNKYPKWLKLDANSLQTCEQVKNGLALLEGSPPSKRLKARHDKMMEKLRKRMLLCVPQTLGEYIAQLEAKVNNGGNSNQKSNAEKTLAVLKEKEENFCAEGQFEKFVEELKKMTEPVRQAQDTKDLLEKYEEKCWVRPNTFRNAKSQVGNENYKSNKVRESSANLNNLKAKFRAGKSNGEMKNLLTAQANKWVQSNNTRNNKMHPVAEFAKSVTTLVYDGKTEAMKDIFDQMMEIMKEASKDPKVDPITKYTDPRLADIWNKLLNLTSAPRVIKILNMINVDFLKSKVPITNLPITENDLNTKMLHSIAKGLFVTKEVRKNAQDQTIEGSGLNLAVSSSDSKMRSYLDEFFFSPNSTANSKAKKEISKNYTGKGQFDLYVTERSKEGKARRIKNNIEPANPGDAIAAMMTNLPHDLKKNIFTIGPSGSGKTAVAVDSLLNTKLDAMLKNTSNRQNKQNCVTVYTPKISVIVGTASSYIQFKDEKQEMKYHEFDATYIRPTPFNPNSSRAHSYFECSVKVKGARLYDLAGQENPSMMSLKCLGINWLIPSLKGSEFFWHLQPSDWNGTIKQARNNNHDTYEVFINLIYKDLIDLSTLQGPNSKFRRKLAAVELKNKQAPSPVQIESWLNYVTVRKEFLAKISQITWGEMETNRAALKGQFEKMKEAKKVDDDFDMDFFFSDTTYKRMEKYAETHKSAKTMKMEFNMKGDLKTTMSYGELYIKESLKRIFEGIYIMRTLHELKSVFKKGYDEDPGYVTSEDAFQKAREDILEEDKCAVRYKYLKLGKSSWVTQMLKDARTGGGDLTDLPKKFNDNFKVRPFDIVYQGSRPMMTFTTDLIAREEKETKKMTNQNKGKKINYVKNILIGMVTPRQEAKVKIEGQSKDESIHSIHQKMYAYMMDVQNAIDPSSS